VNPDLPGPGDDLPERAAKVVRATSELVPRVGLVLGSGLGPALGEAFDEEAGFAFTDLPGFPPPGVPGHAGRFALGHLAGVPVASFFGRVHFYEGHGMDVPALLPRLARELGAEIIIVTAAVGGVEPGLAGGTVAVLTDHLNMMGTTPLRGWRYPDGMPAFVPMGQAYDPALAEAVDVITGSLLTVDGVSVGIEKGMEPGRVRASLSRPPGAPGVTGSGAVATFTLRGVGAGRTPLALESLTLRTATGVQEVLVPAPAQIVVSP
jgi:purine-nucleoside phosphorylase